MTGVRSPVSSTSSNIPRERCRCARGALKRDQPRRLREALSAKRVLAGLPHELFAPYSQSEMATSVAPMQWLPQHLTAPKQVEATALPVVTERAAPHTQVEPPSEEVSEAGSWNEVSGRRTPRQFPSALAGDCRPRVRGLFGMFGFFRALDISRRS